MIMKKYIILFYILTNSIVCLFAQTKNTETKQQQWPRKTYGMDSIQRLKTINNAEFIFEGFLKYSSSSYDTTKRTRGINCDIVEITKVFKGDIAPGSIVKLLFQRNWKQVASSGVPTDSIIQIYFCKENSELKQYLPKETSIYSNLRILAGVNEMSYYAEWDNMIDFQHDPVGLGLEFKNKANVYSYLRGFSGLTVPEYEEPKQKRPAPCTHCGKSITQAQLDSMEREIDIKNKERVKKEYFNNNK
jgi:hypothetical protein